MSSTRLLVLGVVRIFQPVHGYLVRRELLSWNVDHWAHLNPGSIYHALRTLARDGLLEEVGTEAEGGRPARTSYRLTPDGDQAFLQLLRDSFWRLDVYGPDTLLAGLCFIFWLPREEVMAALQARAKQIEAAIEAAHFTAASLADRWETRHVPELFLLTEARLGGELTWSRELAERLAAGAYSAGPINELEPGAGTGSLSPGTPGGLGSA